MAAVKADDKSKLSPFVTLPLYTETSRTLLIGSLILGRQERWKSINHRLVSEFEQEN